MSFEDDMIENGFSDANDYLDYLMDEDERRMQREEESDRRAEEYEAWIESLSDEELDDLYEEKELQKRRRDEERRNAEKQCFDEELILKLWAKDNPQKALRWFACYRQSPDVRKKDLDDFLSMLGTLSYCGYRLDHLRGGYRKWKRWLEEDEAFQEFKKITPPEDYLRFKIETYREYIDIAFLRLIDYCYTVHPDNKDEGFYYSVENKNGKLNTSNIILKKWINDHSELWKQINIKYKSDLKTNDEYLFQAWLEIFYWHDTFTAWKAKNPSLWDQLKTNCDKGLIKSEDQLRSAWLKENDSIWTDWKRLQIEVWNNYYRSHRDFLWYVYTEIKWLKHVEERNIETRKRVRKHFRRYNDVCINGSKYIYLDRKDPRYVYHCDNNKDEDSLHDIFILKYEKELCENTEKALFLKEYCSETEFNKFVNRTIERFDGNEIWYSVVEETPEDYATRKLFDLWCVQNMGEWRNWKYHYCWKEMYGECDYGCTVYYDVWKQLNASKWKKWIHKNLEAWKQNAQNVDLWLAWLFDNNEWTFHEWASENISTWMRILDNVMEFKFNSAFHSLFIRSSSEEDSFNEWKKSNYDNWKYWEETLREQILKDKFTFERRNIPLTYDPEYKLNL